MNQPFERVVGTVKDSLKDSLLWRFSTAWYGTVRFVYGSPLVGFPLGTVPGTWYFFSTTSAGVPSDPYRYQNVTCKLC